MLLRNSLSQTRTFELWIVQRAHFPRGTFAPIKSISDVRNPGRRRDRREFRRLRSFSCRSTFGSTGHQRLDSEVSTEKCRMQLKSDRAIWYTIPIHITKSCASLWTNASGEIFPQRNLRFRRCSGVEYRDKFSLNSSRLSINWAHSAFHRIRRSRFSINVVKRYNW